MWQVSANYAHTYSQVDELTAWLNPKGNRELALRNTLTKWWPHIVPGIRKRLAVSRLFKGLCVGGS